MTRSRTIELGRVETSVPDALSLDRPREKERQILVRRPEFAFFCRCALRLSAGAGSVRVDFSPAAHLLQLHAFRIRGMGSFRSSECDFLHAKKVE